MVSLLDSDTTTRELQYTVPEYFNGTLKVMAVAVANDGIGVAENQILVRVILCCHPMHPPLSRPAMSSK